MQNPKLDLQHWGPLAPLMGRWEGQKGDDTAPGDDRGLEKNKFRELINFTPFGPAENHEQILYGLQYQRTAWRLGEDEPFHDQLGYWLWDAKAGEIYHSFMIPRGMTVLAGGKAKLGDLVLKVSAEKDSAVFGICSNPFLDREFQTVKYLGTIKIMEANTLEYEEDTQILIKGQKQLFHHIDKNILKKVKT